MDHIVAFLSHCHLNPKARLPISVPFSNKQINGFFQYSLSDIYIPGRYLFPGLEMVANGRDIYNTRASSETLPQSNETFSLAALHELVLLLSAVEYLDQYSEHLQINYGSERLILHPADREYIIIDLARSFGKWLLCCDVGVITQLKLNNKKVYVVLAHYYAVAWKSRVYLASLAQGGLGADGQGISQYSKLWTVAPRAEEMCKALVAKLGEGGKRYVRWVLEVIEDLESDK